MSCFKLSSYQCKKLSSACSNFWWNGSKDKKKIHWVSWKNLCKAKQEGGLGFKDFSLFNQALLAKQAWRLLKDPDSLPGRVLKARYFPSSEFLSSQIGYRPSYAWRSIQFGKELLEKGLLKSIGNGSSTWVWMDKWIHDGFPRRPINKEGVIDLNLKVNSLIDSQGNWEIDSLHRLFPPVEIGRILEIVPSLSLGDSFLWPFNNSGNYSVKSGYWLCSQPSQIHYQSLSEEEVTRNKLKARIWKLHTPPKIRSFFWRAISGALSVSVRLRSKSVDINPLCPLCKQQPETINHALFLCPLARELLLTAHVPHPVGGFSSDSLNFNIGFIIDYVENSVLSSQIKLVIPWLIWSIWKNRNIIVFQSVHRDYQSIVDQAYQEATSWNSLQLNQSDKAPSFAVNKGWSPPSSGLLKCNVNSVWRSSNHLCGAAWILRDSSGNPLLHARDALTPAPTRLHSELYGLLWCIRSLRDLHVSSIIIESDCRNALDAINNPKDWPRFRNCLAQISLLSTSFIKIIFVYCHPSANLAASSIAKSVTRDGRLQSYLSIGGPSWLSSILSTDASLS